MVTPFSERVYRLVGQIPAGKVASYGQIAHLAGNPRGSRVVGYLMHNPPARLQLPCHRVLFRDGSLCAGALFGGEGAQRALLEAEGVGFLADGRVDLLVYGWDGLSPDEAF